MTPQTIPRTGLALDYPMSLGVYDGYPQVQLVVTSRTMTSRCGTSLSSGRT